MTANEYNERRVMSGALPQSVLDWCDELGGVTVYQGAVMLDPIDGKLGPATQSSAERKIAEGWAPRVMLDLSHHQDDPDWRSVESAGTQGIYLKATEGGTYQDRTFKDRHRAACGEGLLVGAYHFATGATVAAQVMNFCTMLDSVDAGGLRPVLDLESYPAGADASAFAFKFIAAMRDAGHECVLYTYLSFWVQRLAHVPLPAVPLWIARYNGALYDGNAGELLQRNYGDQIKAWQTTYQGGKWPGVPGRVDVNLLTADGIEPFTTEG